MMYKKPGMSLGDAMKAAKKTWKKGGAGPGGLAMPPMGGRRRTRKAKVGGTAYGFTGGPYTNSDLPDGMSRWPSMSDATWQGPSLLKGGRRSRRGGAFAPSTDGNPAQLPYATPSVAPGTAVGVNGTFAKSGDVPAAFGGRRRRQTKKAGRRRGHRGGNQTVGSAMVYGAASSEAAAAARQAAADRNGHL
jgi:hypothetical protein